MTDYAKFKVAELKELLKQRGISSSGLSKKQQIIDALTEDDAEAGADGDNDDQASDSKSAEQDTTRSTRAKNKRKAASPPPPATDGPSKTSKKAKADAKSDAKPAPVDTKSTNGNPVDDKAAPQIAEAQFAKSSNLIIPVDEGCPLPTSYRVYVDPGDGIIYDASLNQTNASNNNNKFYRVQLLHNSSGDYKTWTRWGRVGEHGQSTLLGNGNFSEAMMYFQKKFKDKSGLTWENRGEKPKANKYVFVERSYEADDDDDDDDAQGGAFVDENSKPVAKCTLDAPVKSLMELIFNQQYFAATMANMNYDANKLPLGKLSKATITRGFEMLKELSALMDDAAVAVNSPLFEEPSNRYYSYIPHAFGRNRPPVISSRELLKREIELLESLSDLKDADEILKKAKEATSEVHPLDSRFQGLGMQEMTPLSSDSTEFSEIAQYLLNTCGYTHSHVNYNVQDIFRIERQGEFDRFSDSKYNNIPSDRRLLWHGSRATNYGGILSQGLRIAPPEAPVSGYMFDKGIYLADMSSKSANYCCAGISGGHALLLLCEAELGKPMQVLQGARSNAASTAKDMGAYSTWGQGNIAPQGWKDAKCVHPSLAGTIMPDTTTPPGQTNYPGVYLQYNEYICYDVAQVRLRYLLRVKM